MVSALSTDRKNGGDKNETKRNNRRNEHGTKRQGSTLCATYPINAAKETEKNVPERNHEERIQNQGSGENGSHNKEPTTSIQPIQTMRKRRVFCMFFWWNRKLLYRRHHIQDQLRIGMQRQGYLQGRIGGQCVYTRTAASRQPPLERRHKLTSVETLQGHTQW